MVYICIYYSHPFNTIGLTHMLNHDSFNVYGTEATNTMNHGHRMMPWWSNEGKGSINFTS